MKITPEMRQLMANTTTKLVLAFYFMFVFARIWDSAFKSAWAYTTQVIDKAREDYNRTGKVPQLPKSLFPFY